jgi:hypothetical protein
MLTTDPTRPQAEPTPVSTGAQLLYFTSSSLTADDDTLVVIRQDDGDPISCGLWAGPVQSRKRWPIYVDADGYLKSYVYFDGRPNEGFGKASVSLHARSGRVYFIHGREVRSCSVLAGDHHVLGQLRDDEVTAFTHVSDDGRLLCVPTTDARALDGAFVNNRPQYDIDLRVQNENLRSYLNLFDTRTGELVARETVERAWITHVQFSPADPTKILYNHEWPADCGVRRMWLWDGTTHRRLRNEDNEKSRGDWVCHEMWSRDGSFIIYHGRYAGTAPVTSGGQLVFGGGNGASFIGRCNADGSDPVEIALPPHYTRYGHFTVGNGDWLVTDGLYETPDDPPSHGAWISVLKPDWTKRTIDWRPVCRHGSSWKSQDEHPHPIFDHAGRHVYFTSDRTGRRAVYRVDVSSHTQQPTEARDAR